MKTKDLINKKIVKVPHCSFINFYFNEDRFFCSRRYIDNFDRGNYPMRVTEYIYERNHMLKYGLLIKESTYNHYQKYDKKGLVYESVQLMGVSENLDIERWI